MPEQPLDLRAAAKLAASKHVVVVGGGIAGLVAAFEVAKLGMQVTVLEASDRFGGAIRSAELAGITVDTGPESFATRGSHVAALLEELGLTDKIVRPNPAGAWLVGDGIAAPLPKGTLLGIPSNPFAPDVKRIIGSRGSWRAYGDRLMPVLKIGREHALGELVRKRMGQRVLDRLVAPITSGVYSADPNLIDVDLAAPGLNGAYTQAGSLGGGVADLLGRAGKPGEAPRSGGAVEGLDGGIYTLVEVLVAELRRYENVVLMTDAPVNLLARDGEQWTVVVDTAAEMTEADGELRIGEVDAVIVATDEATARRLLAPHVDALGTPFLRSNSAETGDSGVQSAQPAENSGEMENDHLTPKAPRVELVTLVLDDERLDAHPRGTGVLTVPGTMTAKALTHSTAKWPWLAARIEQPHRHVIRVSFGTAGEPPATEQLTDDEAAKLALAEASAMFGFDLDPASVQATHRERFTQTQPTAEIGAPARRAAAREAINAVPNVAAIGAWQSGTGLAQVIPDAKTEAERIRRALLFAPNEI